MSTLEHVLQSFSSTVTQQVWVVALVLACFFFWWDDGKMITLSDSYERYQANFFKSGIPVACWGSVCTGLTHPRGTCSCSVLFFSIWANLLVESFREEIGKIQPCTSAELWYSSCCPSFPQWLTRKMILHFLTKAKSLWNQWFVLFQWSQGALPPSPGADPLVYLKYQEVALLHCWGCRRRWRGRLISEHWCLSIGLAICFDTEHQWN